MNKLVKGTIAGAAGIALLLGGAGSFALWNAQQTVAAGSIVSGTMALAKTGTASWQNVTKTPATSITDIAAFRIVPGNKLELTQQLTLSGTGTDLKAKLAFTGPAAVLNSAVSLSIVSGNATLTDSGTTITVADFSADVVVIAKVAVELPEGSDNTTQNATYNLNDVVFTLTQLSPAN